MKKLWLVLLVAIVAFSMTACDDSNSSDNSIEPVAYAVKLEINCKANLFFSRYDVSILVDGVKIATLEHGATNIYSIELEKGKHQLTVEKTDDSSVNGNANFSVEENAIFGYKLSLSRSCISISKEYKEILNELPRGQVRVPTAAEDYCCKIFADVESELKSAGFTNIKGDAIRDLTGGWLDTKKDGEIDSVSISGRTDFRRFEVFACNSEVIITYHTHEPTPEEMRDKIIGQGGKDASEIIKSFDGTGYTVICHMGDEVVSNFNTDGYIFEDGWLEADEKTVHLNLTTKERQELLAALEESFPQENAKRASIVALTNCQADDVFAYDGNSYDISKFHSYSDLSGFYLTEINEGKWTAVDDHTWHVSGLECMMSGYGSCIKADLNVSFDGTKYVVSNVEKIIAAKEYIDSDDSSGANRERLEPSANTPYLTVEPYLIENDRDTAAEKDLNNRTTPTAKRTEWIESQFSIWNGSHNELEELIKANLNDERSYKHIETSYIDVTNADMQSLVNKTIASTGYQVEIGDLFVITEFSAKNGFNATIKSTAYGIVSYSDDTVTLVAID